MTRTVYALLVAIDQYQYPVPPLRGCVNDIRTIETLLRERIGGEDYQLDLRVLVDADATRQAIIDGFRTHLRNARADDVALFYYSGHGSQEKSPPQFWHLEPDRLDETLVCYDSRMPGQYDLADKELAKLIAEVAANNPHFVVCLDCCHSGSGTRAGDGGRVRRAPTDDRDRPLDSFIVGVDEVVALAPTRSAAPTATDWITLPQGKHVLFAACRDDEEAKEYTGGGPTRGVFSYFLTETLQQAGGTLTYRDLFKRASARVQSTVARQIPQLEASDPRELDRPFLGGAVRTHSPYFTLQHDRTHGWVIDGGAVHGIPTGHGEDTTTLAIFPITSTLDTVRDLHAALGTVHVTGVLPNKSTVQVTLRDGSAPDPGQTYKAIITDVPVPAFTVRLEGDPAGIALVRNALGIAGPDGKPSLLVREAADQSPAELRAVAHDQRYRIARPDDDRPLVSDIPGYGMEQAAHVVARLEHTARWHRIAGLTNPASSVLPDAVRMEVYQVTGPPVTRSPDSAPTERIDTGSEIRLAYQVEHGEWQPPSFKVKLINTGQQAMYCALLDLTETYAAHTNLLPGGGVWLKGGEETWANAGRAFHARVPDEVWQHGVTEFKDVLKLIASTAEFDATLLEQDELDMPFVPPAATRSSGPTTTLTRVLRRVPTRTLDPHDANDVYAAWTTSEISITTVRPRPTATIAATAQPIALGAGVTVEPHPSLRAEARLSTVAEASRSLGNLTLPAILRDDPAVSQPLQFTVSRGSEPGLSVLELSHVVDHTVVTPEQPLRLRVAAPLGADEHVLPLGYDGEFYLPLGTAQRVDDGIAIELQRLPAPVANGARDLKGSIRILFQKMIGQRLGMSYAYPLLAATYVARDGGLTMYADPDQVRKRVAAAQRIVVYIHGIIGDTRGMAASARGHTLQRSAPPPESVPPHLAEHYDLLLTFDYENIHTTIEETARGLKQRLEAVGLHAGHGKTLHIVAHSMGGLVARWFIEREGGADIVQHLVMLGTPNGGSPWPHVQAWATTALGIGLNSLSVIAWPAQVVSSLVSAVEMIDRSLDQMQPNSAFLNELNSSPDPKVPYTVLAGNTSLLPAMFTPEVERDSTRLERLLERLRPRDLALKAGALAFFGMPNDVAVSVASIKHVSPYRAPAPVVQEVACDHMSYFSTLVGLQALADALDVGAAANVVGGS